MRMWGGRFDDEPDARMADFTRSIDVDAELALDDIAGSIAHVRGPRPRGAADRRRGRGPRGRPRRAARRTSRPARSPGTRRSRTCTSTSRRCSPRASGRSAASSTPAARATTRSPRTCGSGCGGRSTASTRRSSAWSARSSGSRSGTATRSCPGATHIQPAQPVLFAHHLLAYVEMLERDRGRLADARRRAERLAAGRRGARGRRLSARPRGHRRRSSASTASRPTRSTRSRDRDFVVEAARRGRARDGAPQPPGGGGHLVVEPAVRVRPGRRRLLDRHLDDAEQEEPRPGRARPRPDGRA